MFIAVQEDKSTGEARSEWSKTEDMVDETGELARELGY